MVPRLDCKRVLLALFALLAWLVHMYMPLQGRPDHKDNSWCTAFGYAFTHEMQAGVDWLLNAGPFGIFHTNAYEAELFWTKTLVWECGLGLVAALLLTRQLMRLRGVLERSLFAIAVLVLPRSNDANACIAMLAVCAWMLERPALARPAVAIGLVVLSAFALAKFTLLTFAFGAVAVLAVYFWQASSWRAALNFVALYALAQCSMWMLAGQSLWNVPVYLARSLEISSGYNEAMSFDSPESAVWLARGALLAVVSLALIQFACAPRSALRQAQGTLLLFAFCVMHKAGFTRGDHAFIFFGFAAVAPYLLCTPPPQAARARAVAVIGRCASVVLCTVGLFRYPGFGPDPVRELSSWWLGRVSDNATALYDLRGWKADCEEKLAAVREEFALPRARQVVGQRPIDVINWEQSTLIVNGFHWKPRLTFQSYSAYTPRLLELNARAFEGEDALEFLLFKLQAIDGRMPTMDDGLALQAIARDYEPVLAEKGLLLLRRNPRSEPGPPMDTQLERTIEFDETVDLSGLAGQCHALSLDIEYTLLGRIRTWIDHAPPLFIELHTDTGEVRQYRIVPGMMKTGVILNPLMDTTEDWRDWYTGVDLPRVVALRVLSPAAPEMFVPQMRLRVVQADRIVPRDAGHMRTFLEYSMFDALPIRVQTSSSSPIILDGEEALLVHTPSELVFEVAPGRHVLTGKYGLFPRAYLEGRTDGATFSVELSTQAGQDSHALFEEFIDPARDEAQRGLIDLRILFENRSPAHLILRTGPGPQQDATHDLALWSAIRISDP